MAKTPNDMPQPETVSDFYLAAILGELRRIHELLEKPQLTQDVTTVELKEPVQPEKGRRKKP